MSDDLVRGLRDTDDLFFFRCADEIERLRERLARAEASLRDIALHSNGAAMHIARAYLYEAHHADERKG